MPTVGGEPCGRGREAERHVLMTFTPVMDSRYRVRQGAPFPLGATWQGGGTNFALYSGSA